MPSAHFLMLVVLAALVASAPILPFNWSVMSMKRLLVRDGPAVASMPPEALRPKERYGPVSILRDWLLADHLLEVDSRDAHLEFAICDPFPFDVYTTIR